MRLFGNTASQMLGHINSNSNSACFLSSGWVGLSLFFLFSRLELILFRFCVRSFIEKERCGVLYSLVQRGQDSCYIEVSHNLALCLLAFLWSSGRGGIGYGYLLLDAIDPVEEVGDLAGDSVSVEFERARNFFPFSFLRLPLRFPCHELLLGRPFSQMSVMCLASGILSLHEWDRPLDLKANCERF